MARIRTIKPEFWQNDKLSKLPEATHMLAAALLNYADDEGYFLATPDVIKGVCFPMRTLTVEIPLSLKMLADIDYIRLGNGADGRRYGRIVAFNDHQTISKPTASKLRKIAIKWDGVDYPDDLFGGDSRRTPGVLPEDSRLEQGTGNREQGTGNRERGSRDAPSLDDPPPALDLEAVVISIDILGGQFHVTQGMVQQWTEDFPAIEVMTSLRRMRSHYSDQGSPKTRKTRNGIGRHIVWWLGEDQDRARSGRVTNIRKTGTAPTTPVHQPGDEKVVL